MLDKDIYGQNRSLLKKTFYCAPGLFTFGINLCYTCEYFSFEGDEIPDDSTASKTCRRDQC